MASFQLISQETCNRKPSHEHNSSVDLFGMMRSVWEDCTFLLMVPIGHNHAHI